MVLQLNQGEVAERLTPISMRQEEMILNRVADTAARVKKRDIVVNHDERSVTVSLQDFSDLVTSLNQSRQDNLDLLRVIQGRDRIMEDCMSEAQGYNAGRSRALNDVCTFLMRCWNNIAEQRKNSMFYEFAEGMEVGLDMLHTLHAVFEKGGSLETVISAFRDYDNDEDAEREYYYWFAEHPATAATGLERPADPGVPSEGA